jgi:hypothetical protein
MNIKRSSIFVIIILTAFTVYLYIKYIKQDTPYVEGLKYLLGENNVFQKILLNQKISENENNIKIYGYYNKKNSTLYSSKDFVKDPQYIETLFDPNGIVVYQSYENKQLLIAANCIANENLIEIYGKLKVDSNGYYLVDVKEINDFDTKPKINGGTGEKKLCYEGNTL